MVIIFFLFCLNFLLYSHGMEPEQSAKESKKLVKISSELRANADPFTPPSVIAKEFNLPDTFYDDDYGISGIVEGSRQKEAYNDSDMVEEDDFRDYWAGLEDSDVSRKSQYQQQPHNEHFIAQQSYDQFSEGSSKYEDYDQKLKSAKEIASSPLRWENLVGNTDEFGDIRNIMTQNIMERMRSFQNTPYQSTDRAAIALGDNESKEGNSSENSNRNDEFRDELYNDIGSEKTIDSGEANYVHGMELNQEVAKSPDSWAQVVARDLEHIPHQQQPKRSVGTASSTSVKANKTKTLKSMAQMEPNKNQNKQQRIGKGKSKGHGVTSPAKMPINKQENLPPLHDLSSLPKSHNGAIINVDKNASFSNSNQFGVLQTIEQDESQEGGSAVEFKPSEPPVALSFKPSSTSKASGDKGKTVLTEKMRKEEELRDLFSSSVKSIIILIEKLKDNMAENIDNDKEKVHELMLDYINVIHHLNNFSETYYRDRKIIVYIGTLFYWMNQDYNESMPDHKHLIQIMKDCLAFLDKNSRNFSARILDFEEFFENVDQLKKLLIEYDKADTENTKAEIKAALIEWYTNNVELGVRRVMSHLFVGVYSKVAPNVYVKLIRNTIFVGLFELQMAVRDRKSELLIKARLTVDKYMEIVELPEEMNQKKTNLDHTIELMRDNERNRLSPDTLNLNKDIVTILDAIANLGSEDNTYFKNDDPEQTMILKLRMKDNYKSIMKSLTDFVSKYGKKYDKPSDSDFFADIIGWIVKIYKGKKKLKADEFVTIMTSCLFFLQYETDHEEDVTNFAELVRDIAFLKSEANKCNQMARSTAGYKNPATREALRKLHDFYLNVVMPQLREAISYAFIGMDEEIGKRLSKAKVKVGLESLSKMEDSKYGKELEQSLIRMKAFYMFSDIATVQEIDENLTDYVAKMLGIVDFVPENDRNIDMLAEKIRYPQIYEDGLSAVNELKNQLSEEEEKKSSILNSECSGSKSKGKKKAEKKVKALDFGPLNTLNWKEVKVVLDETTKLIRFVNILAKIQDAEKKAENHEAESETEILKKGAKSKVQEVEGKVEIQEKEIKPEKLERDVYLRLWTNLFRDELLPLLSKWEATYYEMKGKDPKKQKINESTIFKFYSDGIFNFAVQKFKWNKSKAGDKFQKAMKHLSQLQVDYDMLHRLKHVRKWMGERMDENSRCVKHNCKMYEDLPTSLD